MTSADFHWLGKVDFQTGLQLQTLLQNARKNNARRDTLLLMEPSAPVITLGRGGKREHILFSQDEIQTRGFEIVETDRGGDVTYHGPGQLLAYPIWHLPPGQQDVRKYVRRLEEVVIRTLAELKVESTRDERWPGVWISQSKLGGQRKIAALGVHLSRWYTRHGFAINVAPNLSHFESIVACGIREAGVTSLSAELSNAIEVEEVSRKLITHFEDVFDCSLEAKNSLAPQLIEELEVNR